MERPGYEIFQNVAQRKKDMEEEIKLKFKDLKCFSISSIRLLKEEKKEIGSQNHKYILK